jgi:hypothetical protein
MKRFLGFVGVLGLVLGGVVWATDLYVPCQYSTIQAAIQGADDGDTVYVSEQGGDGKWHRFV